MSSYKAKVGDKVKEISTGKTGVVTATNIFRYTTVKLDDGQFIERCSSELQQVTEETAVAVAAEAGN